MLRLVDAQPWLSHPYGTFKFLRMRGGGHPGTVPRGHEFKPFYHVWFFFEFFGLNFRLNKVEFR